MDSEQEQFIREIADSGVKDERVLDAMGKVSRREFLPSELVEYAYEDRPLPIGWGQTISQPSLVAYMIEQLRLKPSDKVLEIGTGSGYQTALLATLAKKVYSAEIVEPLAKKAQETLARLGFKNAHIKADDGVEGWIEKVPFDAIIIACASKHIPQSLIHQLKNGGRLIIPIGEHHQDLCLLEKFDHKTQRTYLLPVQFVPMTHKIN